MRARRWVLVVALLAVTLCAAVYFGWKIGRADERIKNFILAEVQPILGDGFDIGRVEVSLGTIYLREVKLDVPSSPYSVWVDDLRLSYSLFNLLLHNFDPAKISGNILFVKPRFTVRYVGPKDTKKVQIETPETLDESYRSALREFNFIKRLSVTNGEIVMIDSSGIETVLAQKVEGAITNTMQSSADVGLLGKLFSSEDYNLEMNGNIDLQKGILENLNISVQDYNLADKIPFITPDFVEITSGTLDAQMSLWEEPSHLKGFNLSGQLNISNGTVAAPTAHMELDQVEIEAEVNDWNVYITKASQRLNGSEITVTGQINDLLHPRFDVQATSDNFDLEKFGGRFFTKNPDIVKGTASIYLSLEGTPISPELSGTIASSSFSVKDITVADFDLQLNYLDSLLTLTNTSGEALGNTFYADAQLDFSSENPRVSGTVKSAGDFYPLLKNSIKKDVYALHDSINVAWSGSFENLLIEGDYFLESKTQNNQRFLSRGTVHFRNDSLRIMSHGTSHFTAEINVSDLDDKMVIDAYIQNAQVPIFSLFPVPFETLLASGIVADLSLQGPIDSLAIAAKGQWRDEDGVTTDLISFLAMLESDEQRRALRSEFEVFPFKEVPFGGVLNLYQTEDIFQVTRLQLGKKLTGSYKVEYGKNDRIEGVLQFDNALIEQLLLTQEKPARGAIKGEIRVSGTLPDPIIRGIISTTDTYLYDQGPFATKVKFEFADSTFKLFPFNLNKQDEMLLAAEGNYRFTDEAYSFTIEGEKFEFDELLTAFTGRSGTLRGTSKVFLHAYSENNDARLAGNMEIINGSLAGFAFDTLRFNLLDTFDEFDDTLDIQNATYIQDFDFIRNGSFYGYGQGLIPLNDARDMDIDFKGEGNVLSFFQDMTGWIKETKSDGTLELHIGGRITGPRIEEGIWQFTDGSIKFGSVISDAENLVGTLRLRPESRYIDLSELRGLMGGKPFVIYNVETSDPYFDRELEPFILSDLGVNLGIVVVTTSPDGVKLNFPGLMEKNNFGYFEMLGKNENDLFCLAGPFARPVLHGRITLQGVDFGYPFYNGAGNISGPVIDFLKRVEWDLLAVPGKDVRYVKQIPSALDNVYVYLDLDENFGGINFSGQLEDDTFRLEGTLRSTRGSVEYLDMNFRLEQAGIEFDRNSLAPVVYGRAYTTVTDSTGFSSQIYLTLLTVDRALENQQVNNLVRDQRSRARWEELRFQLSSDNLALGANESQLLTTLGYSTESMREKAVDVIGISADNLVFRPLFRPFERQIEQRLGLDLVRFSSRFTRNLIAMNVGNDEYIQSNLAFLRSTRLTVGKYLADRLYLLYTGQIEAGHNYRYQQPGLGLHHTVGLEYRINPKLLLEMEYDYDGLLLWQKDDKRFFIRHWFPF